MNENINNPDYKVIPPFKGWVLENFPFIEADFDAITNYQLISKVVEYLNQVISNENLTESKMLELITAYNNLKDYVDNYFANLDVQEEINQKLDEMATDGTLTNLIKDYVDPIYEAYETEINARVNEQDNQISIINSKVNSVVDYKPIPVSSTSDMTDTTKIYLNTTDGKWYYYDGDSWEIGGTYQGTTLSTTDEERLEKVETEVYVLNLSFNNDGYINTSGVFVSNSSHKCTDLIPVKYFNKLTYTAYEGSTAYKVAYYDANQDFIAADSIIGNSVSQNECVTIPSGASYVRVSNNTSHATPIAILFNNESLAFNFNYLKDDLNVYDTIKGEVLEINASLTYHSYVGVHGDFVNNDDCRRSDFINVKGFNKIKYKLFLASQNWTVAFYDINKALLENVSIHGTASTDEDVIDIPESAYYVIFSNYKNNTSPYATLYKTNSLLSKIEHESILRNKKIGFLGDSITNGYKATTPFRTIIQNNTGCISVNYGINGSTLSTSGSNPACERYVNMDNDLDYVCVLIGINDSTTMGSEDSTDTSTFYGALNVLITGLITKYTTKKIMFCTLLQKRNINVANKNNAIRSRCAYYNIPCYDLHINSQLNANIDIVNQTMYAEEDGLHPNDLGHAMLANKIQKALESI